MDKEASGDNDRQFTSLFDLAQHFNEPCMARVRQWYGVEVRPCLTLCGPEAAFEQAELTLQVPSERIRRQHLVVVTDRILDTEVIFNPLRAKRARRVK